MSCRKEVWLEVGGGPEQRPYRGGVAVWLFGEKVPPQMSGTGGAAVSPKRLTDLGATVSRPALNLG